MENVNEFHVETVLGALLRLSFIDVEKMHALDRYFFAAAAVAPADRCGGSFFEKRRSRDELSAFFFFVFVI